MFPRLKNKLKAKTEHASSVSLNSLRKTHGHVMRRDSKQVKKKNVMQSVHILPISKDVSYLFRRQSRVWREVSSTLDDFFQINFSAFTSGPCGESALLPSDESSFILGPPASASPPACALPLLSHNSLQH